MLQSVLAVVCGPVETAWRPHIKQVRQVVCLSAQPGVACSTEGSMLHASGGRACRGQSGVISHMNRQGVRHTFHLTCTSVKSRRPATHRCISMTSTAVSAEAAPLTHWMLQQGCTVHGVDLVYERCNGQLSRELRASEVRLVQQLLLFVDTK